jgi:hypothetical protein
MLPAGASLDGLRLGFVGIFENGGDVRARIRDIAAYRRSHSGWAAVTALLIATMLALGASRAEQPVSKPTPNTGVGAEADSARAEAARESVQRKLNGIIIPRLTFRGGDRCRGPRLPRKKRAVIAIRANRTRRNVE